VPHAALCSDNGVTSRRHLPGVAKATFGASPRPTVAEGPHERADYLDSVGGVALNGRFHLCADGTARARSCPVSEVPGENRKRANADPSTHHPQTEKRLGPLSLRMTGHFMLWTLDRTLDGQLPFGARVGDLEALALGVALGVGAGPGDHHGEVAADLKGVAHARFKESGLHAAAAHFRDGG